MSAVAYRPGVVADAEAVADLFAECFTATFGHLYHDDDLALFLGGMSSAAFARDLADPGFAFYLAEQGDTLSGYIKLGPSALPIETPPATIELRQLYVRTPWQGSGVAAKLTEWAFAEARRRAARHMQLSVYVDNHRARRFYERRGFVEIGEYRFKVGNHVDDDRIMRVSL